MKADFFAQSFVFTVYFPVMYISIYLQSMGNSVHDSKDCSWLS